MAALFKPYKITESQLSSLPIREGQMIITTDTKSIYLDISSTSRIKAGSGNIPAITLKTWTSDDMQ